MKSIHMRQGYALMCALALLVALSGCAVLGIAKPQNFEESAAAGYTTVTTVRNVTTILLDGGVINSADAQNIQNQANLAREGLDLARSLGPVKGQDRLTASLQILQALESYLAQKQRELNR